MLVADLLHSCSNEQIAAAAISSIGGGFACLVQDAANRDGVSAGAFASRIVRNFTTGATERDWRDLHGSVRGHDFPVLAGLQAIVERDARKHAAPVVDLIAA